MMVLLISGGLDLSVGSILGFTGVVTGLSLHTGIPTVPAILIGLLAALAVGLINGLLVAKMNINWFITTLGMSITIRGLLLVIAQGRAVLNLIRSFYVIGQGSVMGFQYPIFVMLAIVIIGDVLMRNFAVLPPELLHWAEQKAARLSGVNG